MLKEITDYKMWDAFVEQSPQGSIFSTTKWMELYDEPYKIWGWYKGTELLGGMATFATPQPLTPFQGIICRKVDKYTTQMSLENEVSNGLMDVCPNEFFNNYNFTDIRPFLWKGWQPIIRYTYLLPPEGIKNGWFTLRILEKETRYEINKVFKIIPKLDYGVESLCELYKETFKRKGLHLPVTVDFIKKIQLNIPNRIMTVSKNDAAASVMIIKDSIRDYYILGASTGGNMSAFTLWNLLFGDREVDLVGANDEKIGKFKKGFGGKLTPYYGLKRADV